MTERWEWQNWSGSVQAPVRPLRPKTEGELAALLAQHARVRAVGAGHSFMPLCHSKDAIISLADMDGDLSIAPDRQSAIIPAGWSIARLTEALWHHGLSLANQGDVNPQSLAGSMATGTHGTGAFGSLSTFARAFRLMDAAGQVHDVTPQTTPDLFAAQSLPLGLLGIAAQIEVGVIPAFHLAEQISVRPFAEVEESYSQWCADHRHAEFWIFPHSDKAIVKKLSLCDPCEAPASNQDISETLFHALLGLCAALPRLTPPIQRLMMASGIKGSRQGPAYRIFPSDRTIRFEEMEYELPREAGMAALKTVIAWIRRKNLPVAFPFEYRTVAADNLWLSPMNKGPVAAISMHQFHKMPWQDIFREAEAIFRDHGGRPHWAKRHTLTREDIDRLYPRAEDFRTLRRRLDPQGKFLNAHLQDLFA